MTDEPVEIDPWVAAAQGAQLMQDAQIRTEIDQLNVKVNNLISPPSVDENGNFLPLSPVGALTTLLVVLDVIPLQDGANVIHEEPAHLIAEAEAWALA